VAAGYEHSCALDGDGRAVCWGGDAYGQASPPGYTFSALSAGYEHSCGVTAGGGVACWGRDHQGQATPPGS
jgi:hypothetical protein